MTLNNKLAISIRWTAACVGTHEQTLNDGPVLSPLLIEKEANGVDAPPTLAAAAHRLFVTKIDGPLISLDLSSFELSIDRRRQSQIGEENPEMCLMNKKRNRLTGGPNFGFARGESRMANFLFFFGRDKISIF